MTVNRREFATVTGVTLTASLLAWLTADLVAAGQVARARRVGERTVAHVEQRVAEFRLTDDQGGGGALIRESGAALALVVSLLRERTYTDAHGTRLWAAAADLARQRAFALFDVHGSCIDDAFDLALRAAHTAEDTALGGNVVAFWAVAAYNNGRTADADAMATTALAAVRGRTTPRVEAMFTGRRGRARARRGDRACWADFDHAETLFVGAYGYDDPNWAYWFDRTEVLGLKASFPPECRTTRASRDRSHRGGYTLWPLARAHACSVPRASGRRPTPSGRSTPSMRHRTQGPGHGPVRQLRARHGLARRCGGPTRRLRHRRGAGVP